MKALSVAALAAIVLAGAAPAQAASDCNNEFKNFFEKLQLSGNVKMKMSGDELADAARRGVRAYDACKSGDDFSAHGVWDKIEAEKMAKTK